MADFEIINQRQSSTLIGGDVRRIVVVSYRTVDGDTGEVEVPVGQYKAETVRRMIAAEVAELRAARNGDAG